MGRRADTAPEAGGKGKKGQKGTNGKKGKEPPMPPGMAEAHAYSAGCLRLLSYDDRNRLSIAKAEGPRFMRPLLESKVQEARWNARAALLNIATDPVHHDSILDCGVPQHILRISHPGQSLRPRPMTAPA